MSLLAGTAVPAYAAKTRKNNFSMEELLEETYGGVAASESSGSEVVLNSAPDSSDLYTEAQAGTAPAEEAVQEYAAPGSEAAAAGMAAEETSAASQEEAAEAVYETVTEGAGDVSYEAPAENSSDVSYEAPAEGAGEAASYEAPAEGAGEAAAYEAPAENAGEAAAYEAPAENAGEAAAYEAPAENTGEDSVEGQVTGAENDGENTPSSAPASGRSLGIFTTTGYYNDNGQASADGSWPRAGHTVSADWSVLPPGTRIRFADSDIVYTVEDRGVYGNWVDVYYDTSSQAHSHGLQYKEVILVE